MVTTMTATTTTTASADEPALAALQPRADEPGRETGLQGKEGACAQQDAKPHPPHVQLDDVWIHHPPHEQRLLDRGQAKGSGRLPHSQRVLRVPVTVDDHEARPGSRVPRVVAGKAATGTAAVSACSPELHRHLLRLVKHGRHAVGAAVPEAHGVHRVDARLVREDHLPGVSIARCCLRRENVCIGVAVSIGPVSLQDHGVREQPCQGRGADGEHALQREEEEQPPAAVLQAEPGLHRACRDAHGHEAHHQQRGLVVHSGEEGTNAAKDHEGQRCEAEQLQDVRVGRKALEFSQSRPRRCDALGRGFIGGHWPGL
mmetsp:Transcript_74558/g.210860  ORF Transcript_74558/g.210860 Transcript_74558/m.210860 type:complete len:315 (-) Transcript_74558:36-980(-)